MFKRTADGTGRRSGQDAALLHEPHRPIDLVHLSGQSLGDDGLRDEILRIYADQAQRHLARLEASTSVEQLLQNLRTLRLAATGVGAVTVRDLALVAEQELRAGAPVNPERIDDIAMAVAECDAFIATLVLEPLGEA